MDTCRERAGWRFSRRLGRLLIVWLTGPTCAVERMDGRSDMTGAPATDWCRFSPRFSNRDTDDFGNTWGGFTGVILDTEQATLFCDCESEFVCYTTDGVHDPAGNPLGASVDKFHGLEFTEPVLGGADG